MARILMYALIYVVVGNVYILDGGGNYITQHNIAQENSTPHTSHYPLDGVARKLKIKGRKKSWR